MKRSAAIVDKDSEAKKQKISEFPESFQELEKIHFRLNSYFTFLSSRKHVITTFDLVRSSPEAVIKRPLELIDIAKLVYLLPDDIVFEYCDENQFLVEEKKFNYGKGFEQKDIDIFELKQEQDEEHQKFKQLLVFEFIDGNLKKSKTKLYHKTDFKLPIYTPESMKKLIKRRDDKFVKAASDFLMKCEQDGIADPMAELTRLAEPLVPKEKEFVDPIEEMVKAGQSSNQEQNLDRPTIPRFIEFLKESNFYKSQIVENGEILLDQRPAIYGDLTFPLSDEIWHALEDSKKIENFYSHQAQALNAIENGKNVIISTSTSSGKSLIYQIPLLKAMNDDNRDITTMYIFPTKALAQDQKRSLNELLEYFPKLSDINVETFDGDTEKPKRDAIRGNANIIFTNPDMIHMSILPTHERWRHFLIHLKYVVIDELHMYKGLFGSHVALIMRRLRRICSWLGNTDLQFISCSATLKNPVDHMRNIFGVEDIVHVSEDGSPSGEKHLVVWNPPLLNPSDPGNGRESHIIECSKLLVEMMLKNIRTIAFCVVRKACEMLMKEVRTRLEKLGKPELISQVMSYRGGYSTHDRRKIEAEMFNGNLKAIISTNALELGIDIGTLDAVLICGFPLTMANFRQQSGRAGRRNKDSLTMVVGGNNPADQYFMNRPELLIAPDFQDLLIDFENLLVLEGHIQCAAFEMPLSSDLQQETKWFGDLAKIEKVCKERLTFDPADNNYHVHNRFLPWPASNVSIRAIQEEMYAVVDITNGRNVVIEEIEASRTSFTLYDGGIFVHQGYPFLVREFNSDEKFAKVERVNVDWTTNQRDFTDVDPVEIELIRSLRGKSDVPIYFGKIETTIIVFGFFKVDQQKRILDAVEVHNPPIVIKSKGLWIDIPRRAIELINFKKLTPAAGIHAAQHAVMSMLPLFIISGTGEIQTECKAPEKEFATRQTRRKRPARLIFYDSKGGQWGSGLSTKAFEHIDEILENSLSKIVECECDWGCPECVAATFCKENSLVISKPAAIIILSVILGKEIDIDSILSGPEPNMPEIQVETIEMVTSHVKFSKDLEIIDIKKADAPLEDRPKDEDIVMISRKDSNNNNSAVVKPEDEPQVKKEEDEFGESDDDKDFLKL